MAGTPLYQCSPEDSEMFIRRFWDRWAMGPSTRPGGPDGIPVGAGNLLGVYQLMWHGNPRGPIDVQTDIMVMHGGVQRAQAEDRVLAQSDSMFASVHYWMQSNSNVPPNTSPDPSTWIGYLFSEVAALRAKLGA